MKISLPLCGTISTVLADMMNLLFGCRRNSRACAPARRRDLGLASAGATERGGIARLWGAARGAGLHKRMASRGDSRSETARKTGDTARVGAGIWPALYPGAREGRSPTVLHGERSVSANAQAE